MTKTGVAAAVLVGVVASLVASNAAAETADPVEPVRDLVRAFEYDEAIERAEALAEDSSLTPGQRLEALALVGVVHLIEDRQDEAREVFERLLSLDPGFEIDDPDLPPRVQEFFSEIRSSYDPENIVTADIETEGEAEPGEPTRFRITLSGSTESVERVLLYARESGSGAFEPMPVEGSGRYYTAELETPSEDEGLELYLEVEAPSGHVLARVGSSLLPQRIDAGGELTTGGGVDGGGEDGGGDDGDDGDGGGRRRWYASWWFWTIIGVVVASGVVTAVMLTRPEEHEDGTLGSVQMPMLGPEDLRDWR